VADVTLVGQIVGEDVHGECWCGYVQLVADVTGLCILRAQGFVSLFMARKVGACGVVLAALQAVVLLLLLATGFRPSIC